ncbi:MAG TPA: S9 family peptidase [Caulobacteraceae bacterium]|jgi:dipeptidyl aminopeptidase/acylaminoacyl peptidase|nr:S9 family peptidase [Caulobacteraceae bacterium]
MRRSVLLALATAGVFSSAAITVAAPVPDATPRAATNPSSVTSPRNPAAKPVPLDRLFQVHEGDTATWAADGRSVIFASDQGGRMNLWRRPVDGGPAQQVTRSEDRQWVQVATRDGRWVVFQSDHDGHEMNDLFAVPPKGGEAVNLTDTPDVTETFPITSWDSRFAAFARRGKAETAANAAVLDFATHKVRILTHEGDSSMSWQPVAFSHDGRRLIVNRADLAQSHGAVYSIDLRDGSSKRLTTDDGKAYASASDLSPDGRTIALTILTASGRNQAAVLDIASGRVRLASPSAWEQSSERFSPDGRTLLLLSNVDGRDVVYAFGVKTGRAHPLPLPAGKNWGYLLPAYSPQGNRLLFQHQSGSMPSEYWVSDRTGKSARPVTDFGHLPAGGLPPTGIVHYRSADGTMISAVLWTPFNLPRNGNAPAVVIAHGGPTDQTRDAFNRTATALASRGYFVLAPNPRGSTGYGHTFLLANRNDLGGGDLQDEVAGAKFLVATGYVSRSHIGITGGSYGGYMTLIALSKTPDVWAAGVEDYGVVNWRTMYELGSPALRFYVSGLIGAPDKNPDIYAAVSPLTYLAQVKAPLLVLQGENDPRVPAEEARQVVDFIHKKGGVVDAHFYAGEGHGFSRPEDEKDALQRTVDWFDRYLK